MYFSKEIKKTKPETFLVLKSTQILPLFTDPNAIHVMICMTVPKISKCEKIA